jgi:gamma-glutamyltranspeptidase / glutathione hydrolase
MRLKGLQLFVALAMTVALAFGISAAADVGSGSGPPTSIGTGGAAASVERLATQAGVDILRRGGNAVDAAVGAAAVLGVTEPFSCGIGGGGFMVLRTADGAVTTIDGRETAPVAMHPTSFWENGPLPFTAARFSGLSVGVPGTVETWVDALEKFGTMSLAEVFAPAIHVARHGYVIDQVWFDQANAIRDWFDDIPASAALFLDADGTPRDVGTVFTNPALAETYERIAHLGAKGFYRGAVADALVEAVQHPAVAPTANHVWRPGVMTMRDLHVYAALERAPTHVDYRGLDVYSMGPPSSGGSTVGEALNILEGYPLSSMSREAALHYYLEASRYSFADRNAYLADPAYFDVPLSGLLSEEYAATRRALIAETAAPGTVPPGDPHPYEGAETTTHLTTSDKSGNVVSYTFTIESTGGSGLVVPGLGFLLNNELTDFNFDSETHPNRVEGGKRPRSSMAPTIVTRAGKPFLALGSPGGATIITTVLQILLDRIDLGMNLPDAIADPRASQRNAVNTGAEPAFLATPERTALEKRGHHFTDAGEIGAAAGIEFLADGGVLAAAEPVRRGGGSAMTELP